MSCRLAVLNVASRFASRGENSAPSSSFSARSFVAVSGDSRTNVSPLAYEWIEPPGESTGDASSAPVAIIAHGLMGSGRNWRTFTRALSRRVAREGTPWRFALVDNLWHGSTWGDLAHRQARHPPGPFRSANHPNAPCAVDLAADAICEFASHLRNAASTRGSSSMTQTSPPGFPPVAAVLGHSLGGKIALRVLSRLAARAGSSNGASNVHLNAPRAQWWTLDTVPGGVASVGDPHGVRRVINAVARLPREFETRESLNAALVGSGHTFPKDLVDWLGTNLVPVDVANPKNSKLTWQFDVEGVSCLYESYETNDSNALSVAIDPPPGHETHVIKAARSERWDDCVLAALTKTNGDDKTNASFHTLANAGHWLHVDNPDGLLDLIAPNLVRLGRELREWQNRNR